jgi:hypothetical protein
LKPGCVIVVGDGNSTLACSLVASKKGIAVAHVEAGLRSFDREMPEEINRLLTDQLADILYTTERGAAANLQREGIDASRVQFVGNVMIDSLLAHRPRAAPPAETLKRAAWTRASCRGRTDSVSSRCIGRKSKSRRVLRGDRRSMSRSAPAGVAGCTPGPREHRPVWPRHWQRAVAMLDRKAISRCSD